ncbi:hypothetical protein [Photobacterium kishitanii]|uniref:Uncharacterized protein n=1 Tax=Photobacterium kishitanii TaxID=318456 RepID=A0A2T3KLS4_9GAMM|nr:hypothetical protein [Photobacterium kishitanii]PSV00626.1 hypothetical protein C9J27_05675 [Photobacterium kishitanii]
MSVSTVCTVCIAALVLHTYHEAKLDIERAIGEIDGAFHMSEGCKLFVTDNGLVRLENSTGKSVTYSIHGLKKYLKKNRAYYL